MNNKILNFYFLFLFSFIPASIIIGPAISLFNILLIDFSFIFLIFYKKDFKFLSNKTVKLIIFLCLYLVFNSIIAKDFPMSAPGNFGFIRFGILFLAFNYFFYNNKNFVIIVLATWLLTLSLLSLDAYKESIYGTNILGYGEAFGSRIVSFFKDEPIVGGYIHGFYLMIIGYLFFLDKNISNKYKYIIFVFSIFFLIAIILTGERSNSIKAIFGFFLFYFINDYFKFKEKIFSILLLILMIVFLLNNSDFLKLRYGGQFFKPIASFFQTNNELNKGDEFKDNIYIRLYQSGFEVFKRYKFFGVGNKNYRVETCELENFVVGNKSLIKMKERYVCSTHPHQIYFEFLSEHGFIGTIILLYIFYKLIFSKIKSTITKTNYMKLGALIYLIIVFMPIIPSGAFFNDYMLTLFAINLSILL